MKPPTPLVLLSIAAAALCSCATTNDKAALKKEKDEYVYYTPTGSNIPVRVKKSDVQTTPADTDATQDIFRTLQTRGSVDHHAN